MKWRTISKGLRGRLVGIMVQFGFEKLGGNRRRRKEMSFKAPANWKFSQISRVGISIRYPKRSSRFEKPWTQNQLY
jgi:hypothetical protein